MKFSAIGSLLAFTSLASAGPLNANKRQDTADPSAYYLKTITPGDPGSDLNNKFVTLAGTSRVYVSTGSNEEHEPLVVYPYPVPDDNGHYEFRTEQVGIDDHFISTYSRNDLVFDLVKLTNPGAMSFGQGVTADWQGYILDFGSAEPQVTVRHSEDVTFGWAAAPSDNGGVQNVMELKWMNMDAPNTLMYPPVELVLVNVGA